MSNAQTTANNALAAAQAAGVKLTLLWENPTPNQGANRNTGSTFATPIPTTTKAFIAVFGMISNADMTISVFGMNIGNIIELNAWNDTDDGETGYGRKLWIEPSANTYGWGYGHSYSSGSSSAIYCIPYRIYAVEF